MFECFSIEFYNVIQRGVP